MSEWVQTLEHLAWVGSTAYQDKAARAPLVLNIKLLIPSLRDPNKHRFGHNILLQVVGLVSIRQMCGRGERPSGWSRPSQHKTSNCAALLDRSPERHPEEPSFLLQRGTAKTSGRTVSQGGVPGRMLEAKRPLISSPTHLQDSPARFNCRSAVLEVGARSLKLGQEKLENARIQKARVPEVAGGAFWKHKRLKLDA